MEKAVNEALKLAKEYTRIPEDKMNIIKYCCKSLLYHNEELWIEKGVSGNFDNPVGSYDSAKISELTGCLLITCPATFNFANKVFFLAELDHHFCTL